MLKFPSLLSLSLFVVVVLIGGVRISCGLLGLYCFPCNFRIECKKKDGTGEFFVSNDLAIISNHGCC